MSSVSMFSVLLQLYRNTEYTSTLDILIVQVRIISSSNYKSLGELRKIVATFICSCFPSCSCWPKLLHIKGKRYLLLTSFIGRKQDNVWLIIFVLQHKLIYWQMHLLLSQSYSKEICLVILENSFKHLSKCKILSSLVSKINKK